ncbi:prepilin-type N-terminal cleavage/methylation domain-containing protein [Deinococcus seoulensis]|uniref:Prepilin-type N-terminal cleavage/methylation domain-containing protein n=1 Tax=Deinococcus seoulensis TaxID=1837379 RepID=A0ABQ2RWP0_9DEIO|nr:prepilin-type N-terminal cleavage/methylation domain-containing protein [Deinococcus seoulensis]GGR61757.1 prepilin-type N-terminal cleavage/methylation domain-containing protein [Deinococcus seoulensis]
MKTDLAMIRQAGFTLVELLIGMALMSVVLLAVFNVNLSSTRASMSLQTRNDLLPETQIAQTYVLSRLRESAYVYPTGTTFDLGTDPTVKNPRTGLGAWTVGQDAFIAVVLPPRSETPNCALIAPAVPDTANCYTLYAYYPVLRSVLTGSTTLSSGRRPAAEPLNDASTWVLMEYRRSFGKLTGTVFPVPLANTTQGAMVMDYLLPVTLPQVSSVPDRLFSLTGDAGIQQVGRTAITVNLAAQRQVGGSPSVRVPGSGRSTVTVFPRNVGKGIGLN